MAKKCIDGFVFIGENPQKEAELAAIYNKNFFRIMQEFMKTNKSFQNKILKLREDFTSTYDVKGMN